MFSYRICRCGGKTRISDRGTQFWRLTFPIVSQQVSRQQHNPIKFLFHLFNIDAWLVSEMTLVTSNFGKPLLLPPLEVHFVSFGSSEELWMQKRYRFKSWDAPNESDLGHYLFQHFLCDNIVCKSGNSWDRRYLFFKDFVFVRRGRSTKTRFHVWFIYYQPHLPNGFSQFTCVLSI